MLLHGLHLKLLLQLLLGTDELLDVLLFPRRKQILGHRVDVHRTTGDQWVTHQCLVQEKRLLAVPLLIGDRQVAVGDELDVRQHLLARDLKPLDAS